LIARRFPRAAQPLFSALATTLAPLLAVANTGSFHLAWDGSAIIIEQGAWDGVDLVAVQTAVTDAVTQTDQLTAKDALASLSLWEEAIFRVFLDLVNENRTALGKSTLSAGAFFTLVKTKIDTL